MIRLIAYYESENMPMSTPSGYNGARGKFLERRGENPKGGSGERSAGRAAVRIASPAVQTARRLGPRSATPEPRTTTRPPFRRCTTPRTMRCPSAAKSRSRECAPHASSCTTNACSRTFALNYILSPSTPHKREHKGATRRTGCKTPT